jgi:hypothetical protein
MPGMADTIYRSIPQKDRRISVEMTKPNGRRRVIADCVDEAEANAWIVQTKRLLRVVHPFPPIVWQIGMVNDPVSITSPASRLFGCRL